MHSLLSKELSMAEDGYFHLHHVMYCQSPQVQVWGLN